MPLDEWCQSLIAQQTEEPVERIAILEIEAFQCPAIRDLYEVFLELHPFSRTEHEFGIIYVQELYSSWRD